MNLLEISKEINELLENRRKELELTFIEEEHIYYMKDLDGYTIELTTSVKGKS